MPRKRIAFALLTLAATAASAHVTPNVQLMKRSDFTKAALPAAAQFFAKTVALTPADQDSIRKQTEGWTPNEEDTRVYVGRDAKGALVGTAIFLWMPSQHGPVGLAVAFDAAGKVLRAEVTDAGSEPLDWIRPLLSSGLQTFAGLGAGDRPDPERIAPDAHGTMSRYYARVIADGVVRAQALAGALLASTH
jgi:hypothetical protein